MPPEYTGAVMQLAIEHRAIMTDMIHLSAKSVEMHFDMPLAELILDFFDQLKSRTKGYASLDYEFSDYRTSELVKLGPIPIGQRKRGKIASRVGSQVRVAYLPEDPSRAILADNSGLVNV